ncbi:MAG TPA: enoyl-CoA hydratase [Reyranella sp.]|jgi:enoyl-CoA hydratase/carnithine racemase|nr:enoyl-CoA hydratase [Reyranella sp.]
MSSAAPNEPVLLRRNEGRVAILTLNRPHAMNALSGELIDALQAEFDRLAKDEEIRCVVIEAKGRAFSAGHDLREVRSSDDYGFHHDLVTRCSAMMMSIRRLPQPVIAKVHAIATAAGCQLVAACDLAVASTDSKFATPGVNIGLFCGTPSVPLGRNVGAKRALDMLFTGEPIDAATALRDGLVSRVVPADELDKATMDLAQTIASKSPLVLAQGKELFHKHMEMELEQAYAYATNYMAGGLMREDAKLGIDAFVNKKGLPDWKGR